MRHAAHMGFPASGGGGPGGRAGGDAEGQGDPPVAGIVTGAVLVLAVVIGGIVWLGHGTDTRPGPAGGGPPPSSSAPPNP